MGRLHAVVYRETTCGAAVKTLLIYCIAALGEIGGCFAFWAWLRLHKSPLWIAPGLLSLAMFAFALTRVDTPTAGRAFAAYGGIYIVSSLLWMWLVESVQPDRWDWIGACVCLGGSALILFAPRG